MAIRAYEEVEVRLRGVKVIRWAGLLNGDTGSPYKAPAHSDKSFQARGTFGVGGTVSVEGSNDPGASPVFGVVHRSDGVTDFTLINAEPGVPAENTMVIRPNVTAGDGTTSLTVDMLIVSKF